MDTPASPPAGPIIPRGLATNLGIVAGAIAAIAAGVAAILEGDHTPETITALLAAAGVIYGVIRGRMDQAAAALARPPAAVHVPPLAIPPTTYIGADVRDELEDPLLDDPDAGEDEPPLSTGDLAGRGESSAPLERHTDLGDQGPR